MKANKEILLAAVGSTPQIITETLYYYTHPYYKSLRNFDEIKILVTKNRIDSTRELLFDNKILDKMCENLQVDRNTISLKERDIIVMTDDNGDELDDIRGSDDNLSAINMIYNLIQGYTKDSKRITSLISGGRKSIASGFTLAYQMLGREQDELIHVMAPNDKMQVTDKRWFYPSNPENKDEKIEISQIPVLKVGNFLEKGKRQEVSGKPFYRALSSLQDKIHSFKPLEELIINGKTFLHNQETLSLAPLEAAFVRYLLRKRAHSSCNKGCEGCEICFASYDDIVYANKDEILQEYKSIGKGRDSFIERKNRLERINFLKDELAYQEYLAEARQLKSKIEKKIFNSNISQRFIHGLEIKIIKNNNKKYFGFIIDKTNIVFKI